MRIVAMFLLASIVVSCSHFTVERAVEDLQGRPVADAVARLGNPTASARLSDGTQMYAWRRTGAYANSLGGRVALTCDVQATANNGVIQSIRFLGNPDLCASALR